MMGPGRDGVFPLVETMGLEPTSPCLQSRCSSQLSYVPEGGQSLATIVQPGCILPAQVVCRRPGRPTGTARRPLATRVVCGLGPCTGQTARTSPCRTRLL